MICLLFFLFFFQDDKMPGVRKCVCVCVWLTNVCIYSCVCVCMRVCACVRRPPPPVCMLILFTKLDPQTPHGQGHCVSPHSPLSPCLPLRDSRTLPHSPHSSITPPSLPLHYSSSCLVPVSHLLYSAHSPPCSPLPLPVQSIASPFILLCSLSLVTPLDSWVCH